MTNEEKITFLNKELEECVKSLEQINTVIEFFSDGQIQDPGFYIPILGDNQQLFLTALNDKIAWLNQTIQSLS